MNFSDHGLERFFERTKLQMGDFLKIISSGTFVSLGKSKEGRNLCLFFNPADNKYDVAIISADNIIVSIVGESYRGIAHKVTEKHRKRALREFQQLIFKGAATTSIIDFTVEMSVYCNSGKELIKKYGLEKGYSADCFPRCKKMVLIAEKEIVEVIRAVEDLQVKYSNVSIEFNLSHVSGSRIIRVNLHVARDILVSQKLIPA